VGKTLRNLCDVAEIRFVGKLMAIKNISKTNVIQFTPE